MCCITYNNSKNTIYYYKMFNITNKFYYLDFFRDLNINLKTTYYEISKVYFHKCEMINIYY